MLKWWIGYCGESASFTELTRLLPDLELRAEEGNVLLGGPRFGKINEATLREDLDRFTSFANALLATYSSAPPIASQGPIYRADENGIRKHRVILQAGV